LRRRRDTAPLEGIVTIAELKHALDLTHLSS
jgi:hypothetical protein